MAVVVMVETVMVIRGGGGGCHDGDCCGYEDWYADHGYSQLQLWSVFAGMLTMETMLTMAQVYVSGSAVICHIPQPLPAAPKR